MANLLFYLTFNSALTMQNRETLLEKVLNGKGLEMVGLERLRNFRGFYCLVDED